MYINFIFIILALYQVFPLKMYTKNNLMCYEWIESVKIDISWCILGGLEILNFKMWAFLGGSTKLVHNGYSEGYTSSWWF